MNAQSSLLLTAWLAILPIMSCDSNHSDDDPHPPSFHHFLRNAPKLPDGRLIVDRDIIVPDVGAARTLYYDKLRQEALKKTSDSSNNVAVRRSSLTQLTINGHDSFWHFPKQMHLTYCVDEGSFGSRAAELVGALQDAADSWNRRVGVHFLRHKVSNCDETSPVTFNVRSASIPDAAFLAVAPFPFVERKDRELLVDESAFTFSKWGVDLEGALRHELGHILGFRHEHIWNNNCTGEPISGTLPDGATGSARQLTNYDVDSVMHYPQCRPSMDGGLRQTETDYRGAIDVYGMAPSLITSLL